MTIHPLRAFVALLGTVVMTLAAPARAAERPPTCHFGPGALPTETRPHKPHGGEIPIDTIVVVMQENRSFDHYFGQLHFQRPAAHQEAPQRCVEPRLHDSAATRRSLPSTRPNTARLPISITRGTARIASGTAAPWTASRAHNAGRGRSERLAHDGLLHDAAICPSIMRSTARSRWATATSRRC